jgi:hypothetical protein
MYKISAFLLLAFSLLLTTCTKYPFANSDIGTFIDSPDKQVYSWVRVGTQIWVSENLAYLPALGGPSTGSDTDPVYFVYDFANG